MRYNSVGVEFSWSTGGVEVRYSSGGQVEVGKVRQRADSGQCVAAGGETLSRQNSYRSFGPL